MVNYANGKIYKLVNNVDDEIYVGSTCNPLHKRKSQHKYDCKVHPNYPVYRHLNSVGFQHVEIILIEACECKDKNELKKRERHWIDTLRPSLNKQLPLRTQKEYLQDNFNHINRLKLEYRQRPDIMEIGRNRARNYYINNKQHVKDYQYKLTTCECGKTLSKGHISRHLKSKQHQAWQKIYDFIHS